MNFAAPGFLFAAVLLLPLWWVAARSTAPLPPWQRRLVAALQTLAALALVVALAGPWRAGDGPAHRVVVWAGGDDPAAQAALRDLRAAVPQAEPFTVVRAGRAPVVGAPGAAGLPAAAGTPDVAAALVTAAALVPAGARGAVLLCSDGRHDGAPLAAAANALLARGLLLHGRALAAPPAPAAPVLRRLEHAASHAAGEALRIAARLHAPAAGPARLEVWAGDALAGAADVELVAGEQVRTVDAVLAGAGLVEFRVQLRRDGAVLDAERSAVAIAPPLRVLHLAGDATRAAALAATLAPHGLASEAVEPAALDAARVAAAAAVVVDDVPAGAWPAAAQAALREALLQHGTGLLLAGTHQNLGPGGYAGSPLAEVLPVRMPQREERRDPSVALVLIVDTSGSMGGGRLELAKEIARLALQKLQPHDKVGLIEFHGSKRWAAPLQPASNTIEITRALNRLQVGGGTIIYDALEESYYGLLNAATRFRHVLVLTDGGVESGPFEALARRMAQAGQTLSTVLVGPQANSPFLLNLAQWGRGRFYACPDKFQLPDLQFREPQTAPLPAVREQPLPLARTGPGEATAAFAGDALPPTGGFVEASVRAGAEVLLRGAGGEPYLVGWDQGAGRALVLAGQLLGPQGGALRGDPGYGAFVADLVRSAASGALALVPRLQVEVQEAGARLGLEVPAGARLGAAPTAHAAGGAAATLAWDGRAFVGWLPFAGAAPQAVEVRLGELVLATGAMVPPLPREARAARHDDLLRELVALGGGTWTTAGALPVAVAPARGPQAEDWQPRCAWLALAAFLLQLLVRRLPAAARPRGTPGAVPAAALLLAGLAAAPVAAQDLPPAGDQDPAAIRAAIAAELRSRGDLAALAEQWRAATPLHRYLLARAQGDLAAAAALLADPALAARRDERAVLLDLLGRPGEALALLDAPPAAPAARAEWHAWRAQLAAASGDAARAAAELQAAQAADPAAGPRLGLLAAALGRRDLARQWHPAGSAPSREAFQAALRRGLWQRQDGDHPGAAAEFAAAVALAPLQRDRAFALAMQIAAHRAAGTLPALAETWQQRLGAPGAEPPLADLQALAAVLRELGRARAALAFFAGLPAAARAALTDTLLALAVEAGEPEAALAELRAALQREPQDAGLRGTLAVLLADLQRTAEAEQALRDGLPGAAPRALRTLGAFASELGYDAVVQAVGAALDAGGGDSLEGALLWVAHLRRQGRNAAAVDALLAARPRAAQPADRVRLAEQLESLGRLPEALALYGEVWAATATEDVGMRLAWLLADSKVPAERDRAQAIFRQVWIGAGSAARRVQAEERVLDLAAREGNLADLALELEAQLRDPATPNRAAVRDALVKIYTRARDTTGAAALLQQWAREEPARRVEALQQLARVHLAAEEFRNHERVLEQLLQADPEGELDYRQQLAMSALERGRTEDARRHLRGLLARPELPDATGLEFAAGVYALAALPEESVRLYRRALALHPERTETFLLLGNALKAAGQRDRAVGLFLDLLAQPLADDLFVVAVDGLLNLEAPAPVLGAAVRAVQRRLARRPDQVFLHRVLQDLHEALQDEPARLRALAETVVAAGEQRANFVRELMQEAESRRDWRTYAEHGRTLLLLGDEAPPAVYLSLGEALLHLGDVDAAARAFARARLATDFAAVEARVAELYEKSGRLGEAERLRVRMLRRTPDDPAALLAVARLAERQAAPARALPNWLAAALALLPEALQAPAGAATARASLVNRAARNGPSFVDAFAGALRCAEAPEALQPLQQALLDAARAGAPARRLAALRHLRHLAMAFPAAPLAAELPALEQALADGGDAAARRELRLRRGAAGDLAGVRALGGDTGEVSADELRLLFVAGDREALLQAAARAPSSALPRLARTWLLAGDEAGARALLAVAERATDRGAESAREQLRALFDLAAPAADTAAAEARLATALAQDGPLVAKVNQVFAALRLLPNLPAGDRRAHVRTLAEAAATAKDALAAERVLANGRAELAPATARTLVELVFGGIDRGFLLASRAQHLAALPPADAVALVRATLKRLRDEERRTALLQLFGNPEVPEAVQLELVADCDPRGVQNTDRLVFTNGLERARSSPAVLTALAARFAATLPDDPLTLLLRARSAGAPAAQREAARQALPALARRDGGDRDAAIVQALVRLLLPEDARQLLAELPGPLPVAVRLALLEAAGQQAELAAAFFAAQEQRPDDTSLLYRAANFFEAEGRFADAARLYRTAQQRGRNFYPFQAQQLAEYELRAGDPVAALAALRAANDPAQSNFRLLLRVCAEVADPTLRRDALATALQQRSARASAGLGLISLGRSLTRTADDRLAAALQPLQLPTLAPADLAAADAALSDLDLLAFLPEGEAVAATLLRTLDDAGRAADPGLYRGWLRAAARRGAAAPLVEAAAARLAASPGDAEAVRRLLAALQVGLPVPAEVVPALRRAAIAAAATEPAALASLLASETLAAGDPEWQPRLLRALLRDPQALGSVQLRAWAPGLLGLACQRLPALAVELLDDAQVDEDLAPVLIGAAVLQHPEPAAVARLAARGLPARDGPVARQAAELLPHVGLQLLAGDAAAALAVLRQPGVFWLPMRSMESWRFGAAVPPLGRWRDPAAAAPFAAGLLELLAGSEGERRGGLARLGAVLAARLADAGDAAAAAALRQQLRAATVGLAWRVDDWLGAP